MTTSSPDIERIVLMNACEDYAALWQILGEVRDLRPNVPEVAALQETREAAKALLRRGLLEVFRRQSRTSAFVLLEGAAREAALDADAYWRADENDTVEISLAATEAGEAAYRLGNGPKPR